MFDVDEQNSSGNAPGPTRRSTAGSSLHHWAHRSRPTGRAGRPSRCYSANTCSTAPRTSGVAHLFGVDPANRGVRPPAGLEGRREPLPEPLWSRRRSASAPSPEWSSPYGQIDGWPGATHPVSDWPTVIGDLKPATRPAGALEGVPRPRWPAALIGPGRRPRCGPCCLDGYGHVSLATTPKAPGTCRPAGRRSAPRSWSGVCGSGPVIDMRPPSPWAIKPALVVAGAAALRAVVPESRRWTAPPGPGSPASVSRANGNPSRSSTPGRKFSSSTSDRTTCVGQRGLAVRALEIEGDRLLVPVAGQEVGRDPLGGRSFSPYPAVVPVGRCGRRTAAPAPTAMCAAVRRVSTLITPRAEIGQHHRRRAGFARRPGEVDDDDVGQGSTVHSHRSSTPASPVDHGRSRGRAGPHDAVRGRVLHDQLLQGGRESAELDVDLLDLGERLQRALDGELAARCRWSLVAAVGLADDLPAALVDLVSTQPDSTRCAVSSASVRLFVQM